MIQLGNIKLETVPINKCNLNGLPKKVAVVPFNPKYCPFCGCILRSEYTYGVQVNLYECVKFRGSACMACDTFFSSFISSFLSLEHKRFKKTDYILIRDFNVTYDSIKYRSIFNKTKSAFKQFCLLGISNIRIITIVSKIDEQNLDEDVWHYSSKTALTLLIEDNSRFVYLDGKRYYFEEIRNREIPDIIAQYDINTAIINYKFQENYLPTFSSEQTLYIYRGNIDCYDQHHMFEFKATIPSLDGNATFYVEYCYECEQFLMKYSDYASYIRRLKLFPMKVCMYDLNNDDNFYELADESPLMLNGYSVDKKRGLSSSQRQAYLAFIVDHGIMKKRKVLDYLELFIDMNKNKKNWSEAVNKWEEDKAFMLDYEEREVPVVNIGKIMRR